MKTELPPKRTATVGINHLLGSAVVLNWDALTPGSADSTVRIDYHVGANGSVEYLKLWACGREYWSLICDYSPNLGWSDGPRFSNGYHSRPLGRLLQSIMMNQELFIQDCSPNSNGTLKIGTPTAEDTNSATLRINEVFQHA